MSRKPMPADMAGRWGSLPYLDYVGRSGGVDEWHSACPVCGESDHIPGTGIPDRFFIQAAIPGTNAHGKCRKCGHFEWLDDNRNHRPTPEQILETTELRRKYARQEAARLRAKIDALRDAAVWEIFNQQMTEQQRLYWSKAGIPDQFQDWWKLGYNPKYPIANTTSPALSIPYFQHGENGRDAFNIQYRLLNPPNENDRYRFTTGLKPGLWLSDPDNDVNGACLLCEGMKKAAVSFIQLVARLSNDLNVIAAPNKKPGIEILQQLDQCDPIFVLFDPDAYEPTRLPNGDLKQPAVNRLVKLLPGHDVRLVKLAMKVDDLLLLDDEYARDVSLAINRARRISA